MEVTVLGLQFNTPSRHWQRRFTYPTFVADHRSNPTTDEAYRTPDVGVGDVVLTLNAEHSGVVLNGGIHHPFEAVLYQ